MELAGLQHRQQVGPPHRHVLTHAQQQTLQLCAYLDWLRRGQQNPKRLREWKTATGMRRKEVRNIPDSEVGDNRRTSKESFPVSILPPEGHGHNTVLDILF